MPALSTPLVLASGSPRRADLLRSAGLDFRIAPVDCDERWRDGETPTAYVRRLADAKARLALARVHEPRALLLAADTAVWIDERQPPLGKPADRDEARAMLRALFERRPHQVSTAFTILDVTRADGGEPTIRDARRECVTTRVWMRALSGARLRRCLDRYLDAGEWTDKAGAYGIQGRAAGLVTRVEGSYTAVVGLPLADVLDALEDISIAEPIAAPRST